MKYAFHAFGGVASANLLAVAASLSAPAHAQVIANGMTQPVSSQNISTTTGGVGGVGLSALNGGTINATQTTVTTTGNAAYGASTSATGTINMTGGSIRTSGTGADGIRLASPGDLVTAVSTSVTTSGNGANGVTVNGGRATLINSNLTATGDISIGAFAQGGDLFIQGGSISALGSSDTGAKILGNGVSHTLSLTDVVIQSGTMANNALSGNGGILAQGTVATTHLLANNVSVTVFGNGGNGVTADHSTATLTGSNLVTTWGNSGYGLWALGTTLSADNTQVITHGASSTAVAAQSGAHIDLNGGSVTTSGSGSHGLYVFDSVDSISATDMTVNVSASNAYGAAMQGGGRIDFTGGAITAQSFAVIGFFGAHNTLHVTGSSLTSTQSYAVYSAFGSFDVVLDHTRAEGAMGALGVTQVDATTQVGADSATVTAQNGSTLLGNVVVRNGNAINLALTSGSSLTGATVQPAGGMIDISLDASSTWTMSADSTLRHLNNAGRIGFPAPAANTFVGKSLTVTGDYAGADGTIAMSTHLGDDSSPTDRVAVTGKTAGNTLLNITNVGGTGALTGTGIQVVQVKGASNGQFRLANSDYVIGNQPALVAGAYGYVLDKDTGDGSWYLRSSLIKSIIPVIPVGNHQHIDVGQPLYQPSVPVAEAYANTLMSLNSLPTLRQRVGERSYAAGDSMRNGVWGRIEGSSSRLIPTVSTGAMDQDIDSWKAQFGIDRTLAGTENDNHLVGGLTVHYGTADTHAQSVYGNGSISTSGYGAGATLTWYGARGAYVDAQAQVTRFNSDVSSVLTGMVKNDQAGQGYAVSVEAGKAWSVREGLALIPQAQLRYAKTSFDEFRDRFDAEIASDRGSSLQGRLGLALDYRRTWNDAAGRTQQSGFYGIINARHEFLDGTRVMVTGVPIDSRMARTWGGLGAGGTYGWGDGYGVYGELSADSDFAGSYLVSATAGFRMRF